LRRDRGRRSAEGRLVAAELPLRQVLCLAIAAVSAILFAGCKKPVPVAAPAAPPITIVAPAEATTKMAMTLTAAADVNPDEAQRPAPIVVRVYQLKTDAAFRNASFRALYDDDKTTLGQELITRDEYQLRPSERREIEVTLSKDTQFLGAIGAFRNTTAAWRALVAVPHGAFAIAAGRAGIAVTEDPGR